MRLAEMLSPDHLKENKRLVFVQKFPYEKCLSYFVKAIKKEMDIINSGRNLRREDTLEIYKGHSVCLKSLNLLTHCFDDAQTMPLIKIELTILGIRLRNAYFDNPISSFETSMFSKGIVIRRLSNEEE